MLCGLLRFGTTFTANELSAWCMRRRTERHATRHAVHGEVANATPQVWLPLFCPLLSRFAIPKSTLIEKDREVL